jgi:hypothetical protein
MNEALYQQVDLYKDGVTSTMWIPEEFAIQGNYVKRKLDGIWNDGWRIVNVYNNTLSHSAMIKARDTHKYHREGTDI